MSESRVVVCPNCMSLNRVPESREVVDANCGTCHESVAPKAAIEVNESQFDRYLHKDTLPLVVDFWAPWCGPCKMMAPVFNEVARDFAGKARFLKVNTEQAQQLAARYQIRSIPTLAVFKNGTLGVMQPGAMNASQLRQWLQGHL